jgi:GT2 family glycosyltransferase
MIYIIIPVFNRWYFTKACLQSLREQTCSNYIIVVVDHGSTDGSSEKISHWFPEVILLKGDESMWWTAATNLGVEYALKCNAEFILTLNNDLTIPHDYLEKLFSAAKQYPQSLIGSISVDSNNKERIVFVGTKWNQYTAKYRNAIPLSTHFSTVKQQYTAIPSDLLPGRGTLIPSEAFRKVGLFDVHRFPHYAADEDFSRRCVNDGYKLYVCTAAPVFSEVDATGLKNIYKRNSIKYVVDNLFSMRSPNNLSVRWHWAMKHGKVPLLYFLFDFTRITKNQFLKHFR